MKEKILSTIIILISLINSNQISAKTSVNNSAIDRMPVVAKRVQANGSQVVTCDFTKLNKSFDLPLSELVEDLKIVKLENKDEALVGLGYTTLSDNYILVRNTRQNPYKLFDKSGKYIASIGAYGQGPGEYLNVYDDFIDEKHKKIYVLCWQTEKVLVYDFTGKALDPIPLPYRVPKGKIFVDGDHSLISICILPFENLPVVAWSQDFKGNIKKSIKSAHLSVPVDFGNEVFSTKNTGTFDCNIFKFNDRRPDTLYHYSRRDFTLKPKFTLNFKSKPIMIHYYGELPKYYLGYTTVEVKIDDHSSTTECPKVFLVDKKTLKGGYFNLYNDFWGKIALPWVGYVNGYYVNIVDPGNFKNELNKQLENKDLTPKQRSSITQLTNSINENDNNYVIYGKLKR